MIEYDSRNWRRQLIAIHGTVSPKIFVRLAFLTLWSSGVVLLHQHFKVIQIPATGHALIGVALGLLLVFRTNTSYERYWDGRKAWERIANDARNIIRTSRALLIQERAVLEPIVRWTVAYPYACMHALRGERSLGPATPHLPPAQVEAVLSEKNIPMAVATRIGRLLANKRTSSSYPERVILAVDSLLRSLTDSMGVCERIRDTPLPFAYVVHLRRAVALFLLTLPCALVEQFGWETIAYMALISYVMLGIDEIGVEIENPFGTDPNDLPLEKICDRIESDLTSVLSPSADLPPFERPGEK